MFTRLRVAVLAAAGGEALGGRLAPDGECEANLPRSARLADLDEATRGVVAE